MQEPEPATTRQRTMINAFNEKYPDARFEPIGHIVLENLNVDSRSRMFVLKQIKEKCAELHELSELIINL